MSEINPRRVSYKSKYLEAQKELTAKSEEVEKLKKEVSSLKEKIKQLEKQIESSDKEAEEYLDHLKRLKAEFENYKKRMVRERQQLINWAVEDIIKEFLPVLDDLERAIESTEVSSDFSSLAQGIKMVHQQFKGILQKKGLQEIPAKGQEFNPHLHEAIMRIESNDHPDNVVVEEMRKGYKFKDKVLRPAMVKVNRRKDALSADNHQENQMGK
ncbi:nucleotide exchange factor GrpE [Candidatus Aerophobetes bacterium]|uniref:Protein GrpE n=1 Tax=Aerophobetes bacterium TaxID=2030807 RepID=A0A7V0MYD5_UNCAE|nr:nucleotide exchange factor GrpE [Candidatus Aerophobetes bacterium]HDN84275.1 nucleotide exchange factor GrpE [Candidatus Aerophobetes bacterium]